MKHESHQKYAGSEFLINSMRDWVSCIDSGTFDERMRYVLEVNQQYDALSNNASATNLVELRLLRSLWAKKILHKCMRSVPELNAHELSQVCSLMAAFANFAWQEFRPRVGHPR